MTAAVPALVASLALEVAPIRVNLIAAGFVDTPCRLRCSATNSTPAAPNCAPRSRSAASSDRPMSPPWRCT
jgi:NAD(P)-dependent dehydrogenase (short-subunit alcohol dehydrogenase family)